MNANPSPREMIAFWLRSQTRALMYLKAAVGDDDDKKNMQRYLIPSAIVVGVIVATLVMFYMALYGAAP
jgi:Na+/glutamate symporter